jgi:hypothetical protein
VSQEEDDYIYTTSSGTLISVGDDGNVSSDITVGYDNLFYATCDSCKKPNQNIKYSYNWSDNDELTRHICSKCFTRKLDKIFGLGDRISTEEALYGE